MAQVKGKVLQFEAVGRFYSWTNVFMSAKTKQFRQVFRSLLCTKNRSYKNYVCYLPSPLKGQEADVQSLVSCRTHNKLESGWEAYRSSILDILTVAASLWQYFRRREASEGGTEKRGVSVWRGERRNRVLSGVGFQSKFSLIFNVVCVTPFHWLA